MAVILHDTFPTEVTVTPRDPETDALQPDLEFTVSGARLIITDDEMLIAIDGPTGPVLVLRQPHEHHGFDKTATHLDLTSRQQVTWKKDTSCGCGSRLRGWNPYRSITAPRA